MAANVSTVPGTNATLTQKELFQRFLDSPVRINKTASVSTLVPASEADVSHWHAREHYFEWYAEHSSCLPENIRESIINGLCDDDNPAWVIDSVIADLEGLAYGMNAMKEAFNELRNATITEDTEVGVGAEPDVDDFRYVLPAAQVDGSAA